MFRLSNKIVQVNFQDHTEILLNSDSRLVTYVNKKGERSTLPVNLALESQNAEMTKRLKYTKDILTHMLNNNNKNPNAAGSTGGPSRIDTITSAASTKRSGMSPNDLGTITSSSNRAATAQTNFKTSDRKPLNVIN